VIAYEDLRISERPEIERFAAAAAADDAVRSVAEPVVLRPAGLADALEPVRRAELTVSCSYHVALTSLMLGIPAVLVRDSEYYAQKGDGLRRDFALPPELLCDAGSEPAAAAAAVVALMRDPARSAAIATALESGRELVTARREAVEEAIVARTRERIADALASQPRRHARKPIASQADYDALLHACERAYDERAALFEQATWQEARLSDMADSASWRLTEPLRRAKTLLARRRRSGQA